MADAFALVHLKGPDFDTAMARIVRRHAQVLSRTETKSSFIGKLDRIVFGQVPLSMPLWLGLLILAGMLWLGATLSIKEWEELLAWSLVWVSCPWCGIIIIWFFHYRTHFLF